MSSVVLRDTALHNFYRPARSSNIIHRLLCASIWRPQLRYRNLGLPPPSKCHNMPNETI